MGWRWKLLTLRQVIVGLCTPYHKFEIVHLRDTLSAAVSRRHHCMDGGGALLSLRQVIVGLCTPY